MKEAALIQGELPRSSQYLIVSGCKGDAALSMLERVQKTAHPLPTLAETTTVVSRLHSPWMEHYTAIATKNKA